MKRKTGNHNERVYLWFVPDNSQRGGWDLAKWLEHPAVNAKEATVLGSISASSDTVESEGRQMTRCWITVSNRKTKKSPSQVGRHQFYVWSCSLACLSALIVAAGMDLSSSLCSSFSRWAVVVEGRFSVNKSAWDRPPPVGREKNSDKI